MASEVDLCNLALANLGHDYQVTDISPPDGSKEAAYCARFYPIARNTVLEAHDWGFASKRVVLADLGTPPDEWLYRYTMPSGVLVIRELYETGSDRTPQEFAIEADATGTVIYTNTQDAEVRYTALVTDVNKYSSTLQTGIGELLASLLAGPIIKGKAGRAVSKEHKQMFFTWLGQARLLEANGQKAQIKGEPAYNSVRAKAPGTRARA